MPGDAPPPPRARSREFQGRWDGLIFPLLTTHMTLTFVSKGIEPGLRLRVGTPVSGHLIAG